MNWKCHHGFLFFLPYLCCRLLYKNASLFSFFFFCCSRTAYMLMYRRDSEEWRPRPELSGWVDGCKEIRGHGAIKYGMHWFYGSISWEFLTFFHNVKGFIVYIFFSWSHWAQPANEFLLTSRWRWRLYTGKGFPSQTTHTVNTLTGTGGLVWSDCLAEIFGEIPALRSVVHFPDIAVYESFLKNTRCIFFSFGWHNHLLFYVFCLFNHY